MVNSARQVNVAAGGADLSTHVKRVGDGLARPCELSYISDCDSSILQLILETADLEGTSMDAQRKATSVGTVAGRSGAADASPLRPGLANREHAADYIGAMAAELQRVAAAHDLPIIAYLLDMARVEADTTARGLRSGAGAGMP
jgi:hypothetical protein